jgi:ATP-binding cassette subfamily B multidrug efflux pump
MMRGGPGGAGMGRGGPGQPGMPMAVGKPKDVSRTLRQLLGHLRQDRWLVVIAVVLASASVAFLVIGPKLIGNATNVLFNGVVGEMLPAGASKQQAIAELRASGKGQFADMVSGMNVQPGVGVDFGLLGRDLGLAASVFVVGAMFSWVQAYLMAGVVQRAMYRMRADVESKLARLPLKYFDSHPHGDILSRVTNDIDNLSTTLQQGLSQLLTSVMTIVGVLGMMIWISPLLAVIAVVTVPLSIAVTVGIARRSHTQFTAQWQRTGALNGFVEEMHTGHSLVQVFGRRGQVVKEFDEQNQRLYEASFRAQFLSGVIQPAMQFLGNLNYVAIAVIGGLRVASGSLSLGDVTAFIQYSRQFTMPFTQIAGQMNLLQSGIASAERVFELLAEPEELPDVSEPALLDTPSGRVSLEHVSFRYDPNKPLITDFNLEVAPGSTVAIVGPTGAGKTTIVNLLMRFYEIDAGRICLDGLDIRELSRDRLRHVFGMVLQETWLFAGTIRDNIAYGREGVTDVDVRAAAEAAFVDPFVRTLPDGYDTVLDEDASNISAGQRQLLTIARAFLADPSILILDEATSSVDTRTEVLIQHAMARLRKGRTSFVIAHRLSTIRNADTIVVMDAGRIVEQGSHSELLAARGFYYDLYNSQFSEAFVHTGS